MFALVGLGMCFVIMTGGIDLSVGSVAAMASVVSAYLSPYGLVAGLAGGVGAGLCAGALSGFIITRLKILPFIATLAVMLAASGTGLLLANNQSVSVSYDTAFTALGQGNLLSAVQTRLGRRRRRGLARRRARPAVRLSDPGLDRACGLSRRVSSPSTGCLRSPRAGGRRRRGSLSPHGPADGPRRVPGLSDLRAASQVWRASSSRRSSARAAHRGYRLGALRHRLGGRRRDAADRRQGLGLCDARRRAAARSDLHDPQFRERHGLDQPVRLLAVGRSRRLPAGGGDPAKQARENEHRCKSLSQKVRSHDPDQCRTGAQGRRCRL